MDKNNILDDKGTDLLSSDEYSKRIEQGITHFYECLLPTSVCNLKCEYCYLIQEQRREMKRCNFKYDTSHMLSGLTLERVAPNGGLAFFSLCGTGETLMQPEIVPLVHGLLQLGHIVNITTNGTMSKVFDDLLNIPKEYIKHLQVAFSFHYLELKRLNLIDVFFSNVNKVKESGASIVVQLNLYDGYVPYIDEIKKICIERIGALPQVAVTRLEPNGNDLERVTLHTSLSRDEYISNGRLFSSPLFEFTLKNFCVKRKEFCYAGDWSFSLHLEDGRLSPCYQCHREQYIFDDINQPILFEAIGQHCESAYCINSSHYLALGVIPEIQCPSYCSIRNREEANWYNDDLKNLLSRKLYDSNNEYSQEQKKIAELHYLKGKAFNSVKYIFKRIKRKMRGE